MMATSINDKIAKFIKDVTEASKNNSVPKWFKPFMEYVKTLANDVSQHITVLESQLEIQKNVIEKLEVDRSRLVASIKSLDEKIDEQQQYSRRNCLLIHGIKEEKDEDVEKLVMDVVNTKLEAGLQDMEVSRTHRVGRKSIDKDKPRPIIVRFISYRQRKKVFNLKKKLKGQRIMITESLTQKRHSLLKKCFDAFSKQKCWSLDGRIYADTEGGIKVFTREEELTDFLQS